MALTKTTTRMMDGYDSSLDNLSIGLNALADSSLASRLNIAIGTGALQNATTSGGAEDGANTAIGRSALQDLTTGYFNVALGTTAGQSHTTAYNCTMIGRGAGAERAQGYDNTAIGREAMYGEIGTATTSHTSHSCVAVGVSALHDVIDGDRNTAIGRSSFDSLTSGNDNIGLGYSSGASITTGSGNVVIGSYNGNENGLDISTASNNIVWSDGVANIRARCDGSGNWFTGKTASSLTTVGHELRVTGQVYHTIDAGTVSTGAAILNIQNPTGTADKFISFRTGGTEQGYISDTAGTVSLTGAHLSRISKIEGDTQDNILVGTVMSNSDTLLGGDYAAHLNYSKVSATENDTNVAGVFGGFDEDGKFQLSMTGDMVVRIGQGVTVNGGDLLVSAGDGTAKPQDDDIVRSKTVAKVSSNTVIKTYDDGSYLVPCVLMAC